MKVKTVMLMILGFMFICSNGSASYVLLQNSSGYDLYVNTTPGQYLVTTTSSEPQNGNQVFPVFDNYTYAIPLLNSGLLNRATLNCTTPTSDGSGQVIHPSVIKFNTAWHGYTYWMAISGFTNGNESLENTYILASNDGCTWVAPQGIENPINSWDGVVGNYNSDPSVSYISSTDELYICDRWYNNSLDTLEVKRWTYNGSAISQPASLFNITGSVNFERSQSIIYNESDNIYYMIACYGKYTSKLCYRTSADGLTWSNRSELNASLYTGSGIWHAECRWIPHMNLYMIVAHDANDDTLNMLYSENITGPYVMQKPALLKKWNGGTNPDVDLYKSSFHINNDGTMELWYTGISDTAPMNYYVYRTTCDINDILNFYRYCSIRGGTNISVSSGIVTLSNTTHTAITALTPYTHMKAYASLPTGSGIGFTNSTGPISTQYLKYHQLIYTSDARVNFSSVVGNNSGYSVLMSTKPSDSGYHALEYDATNQRAIIHPGVIWYNNVSNMSVYPRYFYMTGFANVDWMFLTNDTIENVIPISINSTSAIVNLSTISYVDGSAYNWNSESSLRFDKIEHGTIYKNVKTHINTTNTTILSSTSDCTLVDVTILPLSDAVDVEVFEWTPQICRWNMSSANDPSVSCVIGGFPTNTDIDIYRDGVDYATVHSNSTGYITWVYSGGFSEHTFEAVPHATAGVRDSFASSWGNTVSMVGAIIVIALAGSMIMMFRGKKDLSEVMNDLPGIILIVVLLVTGAIIFGQF